MAKNQANLAKTKSKNLTKSMRSVASGGSMGRTSGPEARAESSALWAKEYAIFRWRELPHEAANTMNSDLAAPPAKRDKTRGKSIDMNSSAANTVSKEVGGTA